MIKPVRVIIFFFISLAFAYSASANQISILVGPSYEVMNVAREENSRLTVTSFMATYERNILDKLYFSLGASSQIDASKVNVVSFGLYGSLRYYLIGRPDRRQGLSDGTSISLIYPYSIFAGIGAFNKEVEFDGEEKQSVGGLSLQVGGTMDYTKSFYFNWLAGYSYQGESNRVSYSNIEAYFGIGFWL